MSLERHRTPGWGPCDRMAVSEGARRQGPAVQWGTWQVPSLLRGFPGLLKQDTYRLYIYRLYLKLQTNKNNVSLQKEIQEAGK